MPRTAPSKKRSGHRHTEGQPCEDTGRSQPPWAQEEPPCSHLDPGLQASDETHLSVVQAYTVLCLAARADPMAGPILTCPVKTQPSVLLSFVHCLTGYNIPGLLTCPCPREGSDLSFTRLGSLLDEEPQRARTQPRPLWSCAPLASCLPPLGGMSQPARLSCWREHSLLGTWEIRQQ